MHGTAWVVVAASISQGSTMAGTLLVANFVGVKQYGHYALLQSTLTLLGILAQLGLATVLSQQLSHRNAGDPQGAGRTASFCYVVAASTSVLFGLTLIIFRHDISEHFFRQGELGPGLAIAACALPGVAFMWLQQGIMTGLGEFRTQAKFTLTFAPFNVILPAGGAYFGGFLGGIAMLGLAYLLRAAIFQVALFRIFRRLGIGLTVVGLRRELPILWRFAIPATAAGILASLATWGGQTLLVRGINGAAMLGLFSAAFTIKTMIVFLPQQLVQALLPALSRANATSNAADTRSLLVASTAASLVIAISLALAASWLARPLLSLFGQEFTRAVPILLLLMAATPFEATYFTLYQDLRARGRYWLAMLFVDVPLAATVVGLAWLLVPRRGAEGLAIAWLAGWAVAFTATLVLVVWKHRQRAPDPTAD